MELNLDGLEQLAAQATPGPWEVKHLRTNHEFVFAQAPNCDMVFHAREEDVKYITAACNSLPDLIVENRALQERVRVLEKAAYKIVLWEAELPECEVCPSRDECFDHRHGENCVCAMDILDSAKEAAKEAGE